MKIVWKIVEGLSRENMDALETIVGAPLAGALDNVIAQKQHGRGKPCPYRWNDIKNCCGFIDAYL